MYFIVKYFYLNLFDVKNSFSWLMFSFELESWKKIVKMGNYNMKISNGETSLATDRCKNQ